MTGTVAHVIKLIVAHDQERGIGRAGHLPWNIPGELRALAAITRRTTDPQRKNALIMGRATYDSLPANRRPLPDRHSVVVTSSPIPEPGVLTAASLDAAVEAAADIPDLEDLFIFGGGRIYTQALEALIPDELIISVIDGTYDCDTFLAPIPDAYTLYESIELNHEGTRVFHQILRRGPGTAAQPAAPPA
jgi:dihydrofolate reductase